MQMSQSTAVLLVDGQSHYPRTPSHSPRFGDRGIYVEGIKDDLIPGELVPPQGEGNTGRFQRESFKIDLGPIFYSFLFSFKGKF